MIKDTYCVDRKVVMQSRNWNVNDNIRWKLQSDPLNMLVMAVGPYTMEEKDGSPSKHVISEIKRAGSITTDIDGEFVGVKRYPKLEAKIQPNGVLCRCIVVQINEARKYHDRIADGDMTPLQMARSDGLNLRTTYTGGSSSSRG